MREKQVTDQRFGVKKCLVEDLRRFQLMLKHRRKRMAFVTNAHLRYNMGPKVRVRVQAQDKKISITPSHLQDEFPLPRQNLVEVDEWNVRFQLCAACEVHLTFDCEDDQVRFIAALGDLNSSSSSDDGIPTED